MARSLPDRHLRDPRDLDGRRDRARADRAGKVPYETGVARYREIARGQILGDHSGMFKMLFHREDRRLLGVHCIGTGATELVHVGQAVLGARRRPRLLPARRSSTTRRSPSATRSRRSTPRTSSDTDRGAPRGHSRRPQPRHDLSLRPAGRLSPHVVRLRPAPHCRTPILSYSLRIAPEPHFLNWQQDPSATTSRGSSSPTRSASCRVEVDLVAEMTVDQSVRLLPRADGREVPVRLRATTQARELRPYLRHRAARRPRFAGYLGAVEPPAAAARSTSSSSSTSALQRDVGYVIRMEPGVQTLRGDARAAAAARAATRRGCWCSCCGTSAWRRASSPATSIQLAADVKALDGPPGPRTDFTDLHAWAEVYLPGAGWIGLDPTSGLLAGEGHIPLACTADPSARGADHRRASDRRARSSVRARRHVRDAHPRDRRA